VDEGAGEGDGEVDDTLYCTCQRKSYGEMIGCDNDDCQFEWVSAYHSEEGESKTDALLLVPRRLCRCHAAAARDMVLPRLCAPAWTCLERRHQGGRIQGQEEQEAVDAGYRSFSGARVVLCIRALAL
jgi:hypothetical protein